MIEIVKFAVGTYGIRRRKWYHRLLGLEGEFHDRTQMWWWRKSDVGGGRIMYDSLELVCNHYLLITKKKIDKVIYPTKGGEDDV